jgi:hypothetical protein
MTRNEFFAGLFILACANGLLGRMLYTVGLNFQDDWTRTIVAADMNAIVLFACFAGISLVLYDSREQIRAADLWLAAPFLVLVMLPIFALSWAAVTGLSLYILLCANDASPRRRGALILLALSFPMLWSRLFFQFFAQPILVIDAWLVSLILGTDRIGNLVGFADGSGYMIVSPACTSFANISFAFLCWVAVTQWANHRWSRIDALWLSLCCLSVVAVNVVRIGLTGLSYRNYEAIHNEFGEMVGGLIILALTVGFSVLGARRELFSRA